MAFLAKNGVWLTRRGFAADVTGGAAESPFATKGVDYGGLVQAIASGEMRLSSGARLQVYSASNTLYLGAGGQTDVVAVGSNVVIINADVQVRGSMDTITSSQLNIADKLIRLAVPTPSNATVTEDLLDGSGVILAPSTNVGYYEKSIRWHPASPSTLGNQAAMAVGGASNESFWEVRGGALRLTSVGSSSGDREVSFSFRVNEREEFEIVKIVKSSSNTTYQRVLTAGSTTSNAGFALPASRSAHHGGGTLSSAGATRAASVLQPSQLPVIPELQPLSHPGPPRPGPPAAGTTRRTARGLLGTFGFLSEVPEEHLRPVLSDDAPARAAYVSALAASNAFWTAYLSDQMLASI